MGHSRETISISYHHSHGKQWKDPENVGASLSASCEQLVKYVCQKHIGRLAAVEIRDERVRKIIEGLAAALRIPPESPVVRVIHPSFYRYLTGDCKDPRFFVDPVVHSRKLGRRCLSTISKAAHRDMCGLMEFSDMPQHDLQNLVSRRIPQELQYACRNWIYYTISDSTTALEGLLMDFFQVPTPIMDRSNGLLESLDDALLEITQRNWLMVTDIGNLCRPLLTSWFGTVHSSINHNLEKSCDVWLARSILGTPRPEGQLRDNRHPKRWPTGCKSRKVVNLCFPHQVSGCQILVTCQ